MYIYSKLCGLDTESCGDRSAPKNISRDSSVGRASDRRSEGPRFDPGSRHVFLHYPWRVLAKAKACARELLEQGADCDYFYFYYHYY